MSFEHPLALLLLPAGVSVWLLARAVTRRAPQQFRLALPPELQEAARDRPPWRVRLLWAPGLLVWLGFMASVVAAAGPYVRARSVPDRRAARDIALVLDTSESMRGMDFAVGGAAASRMEAALRYVADFIARREGDRIAIVAFGGRAVTQCPLTFDRQVAGTLLGHVEAEMLGKRTALGDGIALGVARLRRGGALVLVSDGANTAGQVSPQEAARAAAARGVSVYAVGGGSDGPVPVPASLPSGGVRMEMKSYALDEATLRTVAELSGGRYFRASDAGTLAGVFAEVDRLEAHETPVTRVLPAGALSLLAGLAGAAALAFALLSSATLQRTAPSLK